MSATTAGPGNFEEAQEALAASLPGYTRRPHQMALAAEVERAISTSSHGLFQAGTGTGKSMALLIPAILSGRRTVVATFNKALQNQYGGDLAFLQEHLGAKFAWATLKGRANYPCHARAKELAFPTPGQQAVLARMEELNDPAAAARLETADREDFPALPEEEWRAFSMSSSECPGKKSCPFGGRCLAERAKARAEASDVVITNTAYLLQDLMLRDQTEGNVALLGEIGQLVIDEAHTLQDVATGALEDTMGEGGLIRLARDMATYLFQEGRAEEGALAIEQAAVALWERVGARYADHAAKLPGREEPMPLTVREIISPDGFGTLLRNLFRAIQSARDEVKAVRHAEDDDRGRIARSRLMTRSAGMLDRIEAFATSPADKTIRWAEREVLVTRKGERRERIMLRSAPVSVSPFLRKAMWDVMPVIMASATLAPGGDFRYLAESLGLDQPEVITYDAGTPFDYREQARLYFPGGDVPEPSGKSVPAWRSYAQAVTGHLVTESGGGALLLFTSRSAMNESHAALAGQFRDQGLTVLRQGDMPSPELVRVMKEDGNAVLFALRTFFEGIDIQGKALRLVVIDKLPFPVPSDLVYQARCEAVERRYGSRWASFDKLTIPGMVLVLTQAFGRLIRHHEDRGLVAILDPRLETKRYGKGILKALPPARQTSSVDEAAGFLRSIR